ncbi:hypothetical protein JTE90_010758 [Oedothorax gibbosus]|uniref:Uncharacterized protein n=1 Tax=Oedothorax gibbosus TaxID=931172 RepID=A0AAV6TGL5_9ARAC|nr:hypothetical protein JTE90_010758 [Oedothorax gibbosus]
MSQGELSETETLGVEQKAKARFILIFSMNTAAKAGLSDPFYFTSFMQEVSEEFPTGITGSWRQGVHSDVLLILRCRLFLSLRSRIRQALDCSTTYRERELGLDRRETG